MVKFISDDYSKNYTALSCSESLNRQIVDIATEIGAKKVEVTNMMLDFALKHARIVMSEQVVYQKHLHLGFFDDEEEDNGND